VAPILKRRQAGLPQDGPIGHEAQRAMKHPPVTSEVANTPGFQSADFLA